MLSRRTIVLTILILVPLVIYLGLGAYALWQSGLFMQTFWILPVCWMVTYGIAGLWKPRTAPAQIDEQKKAPHFTPRDESAMLIVAEYQKQVDELTPEELTNPHFYMEQVRKMAADLAQHYHPKSKDPISSSTVPEVLAAMRLAIDDMERWMLTSVPGSRLMTIGHWKMLQSAPKWARRAQGAAWAASILLNPANVLKYLTSQVTIGPITDQLQTEFLATFYLRLMRQTGFYLVEMNSGRLQAGADAYRRTFAAQLEGSAPQRATQPDASSKTEVESLTVALVGQVNAGKSSLINALIGSRVASSDVLPETRGVHRYQFNIPDSEQSLTLLDTPGYGEAGASSKQLNEIKAALKSAHVVLLVMDAHSPARAIDREFMDELKKWYQTQPQMKPAPGIICLTHIDLLLPSLEWSPPYDWRNPTTPKAQSIHDAVAYVQEMFADVAESVIPVCSDADRAQPAEVMVELLPVLLKHLSEGQMVALLRAYHQELKSDRMKIFLKQLQESGKGLLKMWVDERLGRLVK